MTYRDSRATRDQPRILGSRCHRGIVAGTSEDDVDWSELWRLYLDHGEAFRGAIGDLRAGGLRLSDDDATDFLHDFLLNRAPRALRSFDGTKGNLRSWLFVVFRRFVLEQRRKALRRGDLVRRLASQATEVDQPPFAADVQTVHAAMGRLPVIERRALRAYFKDGERESWRRVAAELGVSRTEARRLVSKALDRLARSVGIKGDP